MFLPAWQMQGLQSTGTSIGMHPAEARPAPSEVTVRALRAAGFAALTALPLLLLASLMLGVPLAGPAFIASGYLGVAFTLASRRLRQAQILGGVVLAGLVGWPLLCFLPEAVPAPWTASAALLAPLFAASPALVRAYLGSREVPPRAQCREYRANTALHTLREAEAAAPYRQRASGSAEAPAPFPAAAFTSDIEDAVGFALRYARRITAFRGIRFEVDIEAGLLAACDRQTCRRIVRALLDCAMMRTPAGGCLSLSARRLRGVVLLQVRSQSGPEGHVRSVEGAVDARVGLGVPDVLAMIEAAGGTLIQEAAEGVSMSVRLPVATNGGMCMRKEERSGET